MWNLIKISINKQNGDRLIDGEQDDSWRGGLGVEVLSKNEKGLMDMENSVVIAVGEGVQGRLNGNGKIQ